MNRATKIIGATLVAAFAFAATSAPAQENLVSSGQCGSLSEWEPRAKRSLDREAFGTEFLTAYGREVSALGARMIMSEIYDCIVEEGPSNPDYSVYEVLLDLSAYSFRSSTGRSEDARLVALWEADFGKWLDQVEQLDPMDENAPFILKAADSLSIAWIGFPSEVSTSPLFTRLRAATEQKGREVRQAASARQEQELEGRVAAAVAEHGDAVDDLGFPQDFLDGVIVLEGFQNRRWFTMREWIAALMASGKYELIEGSRVTDGRDIYGVVIKREAERPVGVYFSMAAGELFLSHIGRDQQVRPVPQRDRHSLAFEIERSIR